MNGFNLVSFDLRRLRRRPAALFAVLVYAGLLGYGAVSGRMRAQTRRTSIYAHQQEVDTSRERLLGRVRAREATEPSSSGVPAWLGSAMDITFASAMPLGPLTDFAVGQSDLLPSFSPLTLWSPNVRLFSKYELDDPMALALGHFDLGQAVLFLLPLVVFALCFDVLSDEYDHRRLGLVLAVAGDVRALVWGRIFLRVGVVVLVTKLVSAAAAAIPLGPFSFAHRWPWLLAWWAGVVLYACFWAAVTAVVASRRRSGSICALSLMFVWAVVVLLIPAGATAAAEVIYPAPSRLAYLTEARAAENQALRSADHAQDRFALEHPDAAPSDAERIPSYIRTAYWVTSRVDASTQPILASFSQTANKRRVALSLLAYLSPAIAFHQWTADLANTSQSVHLKYQAEARRFKLAFGARVADSLLAGHTMTADQIENAPTFRMSPEPIEPALYRHLCLGTALGLASIVLLVIADRRLGVIIGPPEVASKR